MHSILVRAFAVAEISVGVIPMAHAQKSDPAVDRGKYEYEAHCAVCHGLSGAGDGSFAQLFKAGILMPDLTELAKKNNGVSVQARI
jgi:mono/diheme cytochrome c family protein